MKDKSFKWWEENRIKGKWHFVFWHGVLGLGVAWFFGMFFITTIDSIGFMLKLLVAVVFGIAWFRFLDGVFERHLRRSLLWGSLLLVLVVGIVIGLNYSEFSWLFNDPDLIISSQYHDYGILFSQPVNEFTVGEEDGFYFLFDGLVEPENRYLQLIVIYMSTSILVGFFMGMNSWHSWEESSRKERAKREESEV